MEILSHYVTRSLTEPWEYGQRRLRYFDFAGKKFSHHPSKSLLAIEGLLNRSEEDFFSKHVETQIGLFKKHHLNNLNVQDRKVYRAPFLYILVQMERLHLAKKKESSMISNPFNKSLFEFNENEIETTVQAMESQYKLALLNTEKDDYLFFPETGFFKFPIFDSNKYIDIFSCFAIPIDLRTALCIVPNIVDTEMILNSKKMLSLYSVGLNNEFCSKVLLPPLERIITEEELEATLIQMRTDAIKFQMEIESIQFDLKKIRNEK